ncbi:vWA domain-containing protein [Algibacillus agarilyticus]|uniref:vWA domain-containing protein n=1 Tax=Algibacillus agarilyticus TaxID=2234133 RepID=UPI000DD0691B|nr:VWA-like domain-containing protein [Algibacillus agarilyticus]
MSSDIWSQFLLYLRKNQPFFSTFAMYCQFKISMSVDFAETSGKTMHINSQFFESLSLAEKFSFLLHQVLHLSLQHPLRGQHKQTEIWNIAADIAVNLIITDCSSLKPAPFTAWDNRYKGCTAEEIYNALITLENESTSPSCVTSPNRDQQQAYTLSVPDLDPDEDPSSDPNSDPSSNKNSKQDDCHNDSTQDTEKVQQTKSSLKNPQLQQYRSKHDVSSHKTATEQNKQLKPYWDKACQSIRIQQQKLKTWGNIPELLKREFEIAISNKVDWRSVLWRYCQTRLSDFKEFDWRFVSRGLYREEMYSEGLHLAVAIDTSSSVSQHELSIFMAELNQIIHTFTDIDISLYFADADIVGPYALNNETKDLPIPRGGGGTTFNQFFKKIETDFTFSPPDALLYLTDGGAIFPTKAPEIPTLWLITDLSITAPFGTTIHIDIA